MTLPGKTEAGSAGMHPCRGITWWAHRDDGRSAGGSLSRSSETHRIGRPLCLENPRPKGGMLANAERPLSTPRLSANRNVFGQRGESHKLYQRAVEIALRWGLRDVASEFDEADARADALSGNCQTVHRLGRPALALALCGDAAQAEKLAAETSKLFPNGTIWNAVQLPDTLEYWEAALRISRAEPSSSDLKLRSGRALTTGQY
jgi:hypothetical protein